MTAKWVRVSNPKYNRLPFGDWKQDFFFHKELHMSTKDIQNLSMTERVFYTRLLEELWEKDQRDIDRAKQNQKNKSLED